MHISHNLPLENTPPIVVIFGCGNVLLGDDGFGPAVIAALEHYKLPPAVTLIDAGTSIREYLLDYLLLPSLRPKLVIVVDAGYEEGGAPGQVRECAPSAIPAQKIHDFSLHQFPTVNLLKELHEETGITVVLLIAQTACIPDVISPGLSKPVRDAVDEACSRILRLVTPSPALEATGL